MKEKIQTILSRERDPSIRFEVLEKFYGMVDCEDDARFILNILRNDTDPCVRHEAAAQLFRIEEKKPRLLAGIKSEVIASLLERANHDESTVVRHESIEALGYIGDQTSLPELQELAESENLDIRSTAEIALRTAQRRLNSNLSAGDLSLNLIQNWSG